jgi:iron complex outermembrane receptor protein
MNRLMGSAFGRAWIGFAMAGMALAGEASEVEEVTVLAPRMDTLGLSHASVTGSRLQVDALDLPQSVSAIDQVSMQVKAQATVTDAASGTTGLTGYARAGAAGVYSWRGFTENAIATLYDGIRVQGSTVTTRQYDTFAFERIEIARGPASSLHGEGALSGAINYVRKQPHPSQDVETELLAAAGSYDSWRIGVGVNGSITDSLHARADVIRNEMGSQVHGNRTELTHAVGSLLWNVTEEVSMLFLADHFSADTDDAYWGTPVIGNRVAFALRKINYNNATDNRYRDDVDWLLWRTDWRIDDQVRVRNQAYRYEAERDWRNIGRFLWNAASAQVGRTFWEDLAYDHEALGDRLELSVDGSIAGFADQLVVGTEISRTDFASPRNYSVPFGLQQLVDPYHPAAVDFFDFGNPRVRARDTKLRQWAVFLENRLQISEQVAVQTALRRDRLDADFRRFDTRPTQSYSADYDPTTWSAGLIYKPFATGTAYLQYGRSVTPADSLLVIGDPATAAFDLTEGQGAEIGFKQIAFGGKWEWTVALYDLKQRNIPSTDPNNPASTRLIGEMSSRGAEIAVAWRPTAALLIEANAAALDAEYDTFREGAANRAGNRPPNVPRRVLNLDADYAFDTRWSAGASLRHVGDVTANTSNSVRFPSYTVSDLRVRFAFDPANDLSLFVFNVMDEVYAAWATSAGGHSVMANIGAPRTASVQWRSRF